MFEFLKKNGEEKAKISSKKLRIEVEDMIDQGFSCQEIAEEVGTKEEAVYKIKQNYRRRQARTQDNSGDAPSSTSSIREAELELARLKIEAEKQKLAWELADRRQERVMQLRELYGGEEGEEGGTNIEDKLFVSLMAKLIGQSSPPTGGAGGGIPPPPSSPPPPARDDSPTFPEYFSWMIEDIKSGKVSEEDFAREVGAAGLPVVAAKKIYQSIKK